MSEAHAPEGDDAPDAGSTAVAGLVALVLAGVILAGSAATWPEVLELRQDEHNLLRVAGALAVDGRPPRAGPAVAGTSFHLGPAYLWLLGGARVLAGSFSGALWVLAAWNALAAPVWVLGARHTLGLRAATLVALAITASPLTYAELSRPLLHAHYGVLPASVAWVAALRLARSGGSGALAVAAFAAGVTLHFHVTWLPLLAVVAVAAWRARSRLDRPAVIIALLLVALTHAQALAALGPRTVQEIVAHQGGADGYALGEALAQVALVLRGTLPGGVATLGLVVLISAGLAARAPRTPAGLLAATALASVAGHATLFALLHAQWVSTFYTSTVGVALACATAATLEGLARLLPPRAGRALPLAAAAVLALHATRTDGRLRGAVPLYAWNDLRRAEAAVEALRAAGVGLDDLTATLPRVHGLPCRVLADPPCFLDPLVAELPTRGSLGEAVRLGWAEGWPVVLAEPACLRAVPPASAELDCGRGALLVATREGDEAVALTLDDRSLDLIPLPIVVGKGERAPRLWTTEVLPLQGRAQLRTTAPVVDLLVGPRPWVTADVGWFVVREPDLGTPTRH